MSRQRELLVNAKVAHQWEETFDFKIDELMAIIDKIDTEKNMLLIAELLDVYRKTNQTPVNLKRKVFTNNCCDKQFEFLVFRN